MVTPSGALSKPLIDYLRGLATTTTDAATSAALSALADRVAALESGQGFDIYGQNNRITIIGDTDSGLTVDIAAGYVGQTSITTLGTITVGTWNGTVIGDAYIASALTGKTYNGLTLAHNGAGTFTIEEPFALHILTVSDSTTLNGGTVNGGTHSGVNTGDQDLSGYALLTSTITNGDTTHAPSGDAVYDALAALTASIAAIPLGCPTTMSANYTVAANTQILFKHPIAVGTYDLRIVGDLIQVT